MPWPFVKMLFAEGLRTPFTTITEAMTNVAHRHISVFGQSKNIEDGFHHERRGESERDNGRTHNSVTWLLPIQASLFSSVRRFKDMVWTPIELSRADLRAGLPTGMHAPRKTRRTIHMLDGMVTTTAKQAFPTFNGHYSPRLASDLARLGHYHGAKQWMQTDKYWLVLLVFDGILRRQVWHRAVVLVNGGLLGNYCLSHTSGACHELWQ